MPATLSARLTASCAVRRGVRVRSKDATGARQAAERTPSSAAYTGAGVPACATIAKQPRSVQPSPKPRSANLPSSAVSRSGSFEAPDHEYPSHLLLDVAVTDRRGMTVHRTRRLDPATVDLMFATKPKRLVLTAGGVQGRGPFTKTFVVGGQLIVSGPSSLDKLKGTFLAPYLPGEAAETVRLEQSAFDELNRTFSLKRDPAKVAQLGARAKGLGLRTIEISQERPMIAVEMKKHPSARDVNGTGGLVVERRVGGGRIVVTRFPLTDVRIKQWRNFDGFFNAARSVAVHTGSDTLYVVDRDNQRLQKFVASTGAFVGWIGRLSSVTGASCSAAGTGNFTGGWCTGGTANTSGVNNGSDGRMNRA